jgi:dihydropyrimidinase
MWKDKLKGKDDFTKIPNGAPGLEHRLELLYSEGVKKERICLNKLVEITSTNVAKIFGLFPKKGTIAVGSDADIVIFDPEEKHTISAGTHHHRCDYSAYEGWQVTGKTKAVLLRGEVAIENNEVKIEKGYGRFLKRGISL